MPPEVVDQQKESVEEQTETVQADGKTSGVEENAKGTGAEEESTEEEQVELIGKDQYEALKGDPVKLMKELNKAATKKFQSMSAERKAMEPYSQFIKALDADPVEAITRVAKQLGIKIEASTEKKTEQNVATLADQVTAKIRTALGPDYEEIADKIGVGVHEAMMLAIPELTKGTDEKINSVISESAARESALTLEAFGKKHPDWQKHEAAMTAMAEKFPPGKNVSELEYLENLYYLATREASTGDGVKKVIEKMNKSAKGGGETTTVDGKSVSKTPPRPPTFREAAAAAQRGEKFE